MGSGEPSQEVFEATIPNVFKMERYCISIGKYHINQLSPARVRAGLGLFSHWGGRKMLRVERSAARSANRSVKRAGVDHLTAARQPPAAQHRGLVAQCSRSEIASETPSETPNGLIGAKSQGFVNFFIKCLQNEGCCVSIGKYHIN